MENSINFKYCLIVIILIVTFTQNIYGQKDCDSFLKVLEHTESEKEKTQILIMFIESDDDLNNIKCLRKALAIEENIGDLIMQSKILLEMGKQSERNSSFSLSLDYLHESLELSKEANRFEISAEAAYSIGQIYQKWQNYDKSKEFMLMSLDYALKTKQQEIVSECYNSLAKISLRNNELNESKMYFNKFLELKKKSDDTIAYLMQYYINLSSIYYSEKKLDSMKYFIDKAMSIITDSTDNKYKIPLYNNLSSYYLSTKIDFDSCYKYANEVIKLTKNPKYIDSKILAYLLLYSNYKNQGQHDSALYYNEKYIVIKDSVYNKKQQMYISDFRVQLEAEKQYQIIKRLEQKAKLQRIFVIGIGIVALLIIAILILFYNRAKLKSRLLEKEKVLVLKEKDLILKEKELINEKAESLNARVENQRNEMINNALYVIRQNQIADSIRKDLKKLLTTPLEKKEQIIKELYLKLHKNRKSIDKKNFEIKFNRTYQNFYNDLSLAFPSLTRTQQDLCAYIKLNMSIKEIASLTGQTIRSVEQARTRLRKRLNLQNRENLTDFLSKF